MKYSVTIYDGGTTTVIFEGLSNDKGIHIILTKLTSIRGPQLNQYTHNLVIGGETRIPPSNKHPYEIYITKL